MADRRARLRAEDRAGLRGGAKGGGGEGGGAKGGGGEGGGELDELDELDASSLELDEAAAAPFAFAAAELAAEDDGGDADHTAAANPRAAAYARQVAVLDEAVREEADVRGVLRAHIERERRYCKSCKPLCTLQRELVEHGEAAGGLHFLGEEEARGKVAAVVAGLVLLDAHGERKTDPFAAGRPWRRSALSRRRESHVETMAAAQQFAHSTAFQPALDALAGRAARGRLRPVGMAAAAAPEPQPSEAELAPPLPTLPPRPRRRRC